MIIEANPAVPARTINTSALFQIPRMITQEAFHVVTFDVMTHTPSELTHRKTKQPLNDDLNIEHYCVPVIHPTTREIMTKY